MEKDREEIEEIPLYLRMEIQEDEVEEFIKSRMWQVIVAEIQGRDKVIDKDLRDGNNSLGNDDTKRGRLNEIEFILTIPRAIITDIRISKTKKDNEESKEN